MKKLTQRVTLLAFLFACCTFYGNAQIRTITGHVFDEKNNPIAGVTVSVRGTATATTTGENGSFSISAASTSELVFTHVSFETKTVRVGSGAS